MKKAKMKQVIKMKPVIFTISGAFLILILTVGIVLTRPTATKSEFDVNGLNDQVQNHEGRIGDLEDKTDKTQTQTNQNTADINKLQANTGTSAAPTVPDVHTPVTTVPPPTVTPPPPDPNNNSWTNSHGSFIWKNMLGTVRLVADHEFPVAWSLGPCGNNVRNILIPSTITGHVSANNPTSVGAKFSFSGNQVKYYDASHRELLNCAFSEFSTDLKNIPGDSQWPGTIGIWW